MKTHIIPFLRCLSIEQSKYKRTYAFTLSVLAPAFLAAVVFLIYFFKAEQIVGEGMNGWRHMINYSLQFSTSLLFPLFIILLVVFIHNIDHKIGGQRLTRLLPIPHLASYLSKVMVAFSFLILSMLLFTLFINAGAYMNSLKYPALFQFERSIIAELMVRTGYIALCSIFMFAIQYWISQRFSNIIVPVGVGFAGFISAIILMQGWEYIDFHPYALFMLVMSNSTEPEITRQLITYSLTGSMVIFFLAYLDLKHRKYYM